MRTSKYPKQEAISFPTKGKTQRGEAGGLEAALHLHHERFKTDDETLEAGKE